jgi:aminopeptidase N
MDGSCKCVLGPGFLAWVLLVSASAVAAPGRVFGDRDVWRWPPSRTYHVENYKLMVHFDEARGEVLGDEVITLRPFRPHFREFYLDSAETTTDSVVLEPARGGAVRLPHRSQDSHLWIRLDRDYDATGLVHVRIIYHAFPRTGLFFVNPSPHHPNWPHEVYSQGEPELNHYWFPCWDYPNDMATSEVIATVPEGQIVVSNGKLAKATHSAGQATYDWVEKIPHSSYLISIAVGPWRKFSDEYKNKPVDYYVPATVDESTARRSFHLTPDMIGFFSRATGVEYPYEQYAQTTVQNYIFGGQENVSATTLTDMTLHDERAEADYPSTNLVSHELGQHWFGDFVQGRDWANIWLNEGFATYLEALYTQHREGYDAYRFAIYNDRLAEHTEDEAAYRRPLVDHHYADPLDMFDATTHEKGADVLDMLRYVIDGAEAASRPASQSEPFFQALHDYLTAHREQTADTQDLLDAIRATTGEELDWFFREWVFMAGHPDYRVEAGYDAAKKIEKISVVQTQASEGNTPVFDMPIELAFYGAGGERKKIQVRDDLRQQEFAVPLDFEPQWVDFDPENFIDKTLRFEQPLEALVASAEKSPSMMSRLRAVQQLSGSALEPGSATPRNVAVRLRALAQALSADRFYAVRAAAAAGLGTIDSEQAKSALLAARSQPDSRVRSAVVEALGRFSKDPSVYGTLVNSLQHDASYAVEAAAAKELGKSGMPQAFDVLQGEIRTTSEIHVIEATLAGLAATKNPGAVEILLAQAQPDNPERVRLYALAGLESFRGAVAANRQPELVEAVRAALHDPFYPLREVAEELVGVFGFSEFEAEIRTEAQHAPMAMQRQAAQKVLDQWFHQP